MAIIRGIGRALSALFWLTFPVVPLLIADAYFSLCTFEPLGGNRPSPDPYDWYWTVWLVLVGPLVGFGFLAGATWKIGDEPARSRWRGWMSRRAAWVGLGPWLGGLTIAAVGVILYIADWMRDRLGVNWPESWNEPGPMSERLTQALQYALLAWLPMAWLIVARSALLRARRMGRLPPAIGTGLGLAALFTGTLFGGYWLVTSAWRDYYFDPTIVP